jgi:leucyl/phenylalanyl-tRNA--protein transferase
MAPQFLEKGNIWLPDPEGETGDIVAVGGDLIPERLILAYSKGIFPWYNRTGQYVWWSPMERCILRPCEVSVTTSTRKSIKSFSRFTADHAFDDVIRYCAELRKGNTWILKEMIAAYNELAKMGFAHSIEVWDECGSLAGGLYGVSIGETFFGESMFTRKSNASKVALIALCRYLHSKGWKMIDCQVSNDHLLSMGAKEIPRKKFLTELRPLVSRPTFQGSWSKDFASFIAKNPELTASGA